ncbi:Alpha-1,4-glucan-protein synthase [Hordeum vulgare]|nr:Alpha-1,4-glucan-protein synthase [Hordeum vulgare]
MWSAGCDASSGDDLERQRCVAFDGARKRATRRYTKHGQEPPLLLLCREMEEYDCRLALLRRGLSSGSSAMGSSFVCASSLRIPVKREREELTLFCSVKRGPEAEAERRGVIGTEDYLPPMKADVMEAAVIAHFTREEEEEVHRR